MTPLEAMCRAAWDAREKTMPERTRMSWDKGSPLSRLVLAVQMRAALDALAENVSEAMIFAGDDAAAGSQDLGDGLTRAIWSAMISAAIGEAS